MMEVIVDVINDAVETLTEAEIARAKAQMKAGLLMALESCSIPRAEQLARHGAALWPAADGGASWIGHADRSACRVDRPATLRWGCCRGAGWHWSRLAAAGVWTRRWLCGRIDAVEGEDLLPIRHDPGVGFRSGMLKLVESPPAERRS